MVVVKGDRLDMRVFMACCKYDELGTVDVINALGNPLKNPVSEKEWKDFVDKKAGPEITFTGKFEGETAHGRQEPQEQTSEQEADPKDPPRRRRRAEVAISCAATTPIQRRGTCDLRGP